MRYLYKRGRGARRRVMHLTPFDARTGEPTMRPLCPTRLAFDTTINLPMGQRLCRRCRALLGDTQEAGG